MRYIDAWKMEECVYTIYQNNEGNRFYIFRKEKDGNSNQLRVAFKSAEDAKAWVNNVLIPAWQNWHDCNKLAGQVYLDDPDELNETKNINVNIKKQTIKLNESQLKQMIKEALSRNDVLSGQKYWQDETPKGEMNKIRHSRYQGLVEIIEYYSAQDDDGKSLSKEQCEQLKNACDTIDCFGELGQQWAKIGKEILSRNEHASINESQLRKMIKESIKNILRESVEDEALNFVQSVNSKW